MGMDGLSLNHGPSANYKSCDLGQGIHFSKWQFLHMLNRNGKVYALKLHALKR